MEEDVPVRMPLYRHPEQAKMIIAEMISNMLAKDVIEESTAAYLSPIVLVSKPDGSKRMCIRRIFAVQAAVLLPSGRLKPACFRSRPTA